MKILKRMGSMLLCALLLLALSTAVWADQEAYTYRITFHAGNQGKFVSDQLQVQGSGYNIRRTDESITVSGLRQGDRVIWNSDTVVLTQGSRYYIRGVRLSGRDNNTVDATSFSVQGDQDYVVAYGIRGETVSYRIEYQDTNGKQLRESRTMQGNVGDKPVVAAVFIEGYVPQAYNLTGTLQADESKNVFTFVYRTTAAANTGKTNTNAGSNANGSNQNNNGTTQANAGNNAPQAGGNAQDQTGAQNQAPAQGEGDAQAQDGQTEEEVPEIIDIDDEQTPLASGRDLGTGQNAQLSNEANRVGLLLPGVAVISALAVVGLTIWWRISDKKKKK